MSDSLNWFEQIAGQVRPEDLPGILIGAMKSSLSSDQKLEAIDEACDQLEAHFASHCMALLVEGIRLAEQFENTDRERLFRQRLGVLHRAARTASPPSLSFVPGDLINNRLTVYCGLQGGMGEVLFCRDEWYGTFCVVKLPQRSGLLNDYFIDECTGWLLVSGHQNIATALFAGNVGTRPYLVIDYVAGQVPGHSDLRSLLRLRRLEFDEAIDLCLQFCDGMIRAHDKVPGIVHRDIKPDNILLDFSGTLKIADWGLIAGALPADSAGVVTVGDERVRLPQPPRESLMLDARVGTWQYMSPEQCGRQPVSVESDVYSFGCVMYEMFAGRPPFLCRREVDYVNAHIHEMPQALEEIAPVSHELSSIVQKCLEKCQARRYATFADLKAALADLPTEGSSDATAKRAARIAARLKYAAKESYSQRIERCIGLSQVGKHEIALRMLEPIVAECPDEAYGWFVKGNILNELSRHREGIAALRKALLLDPESPSILYNLGIREKMHGDEDLGLQLITRAAELGHEKARELLTAMQDGDIDVLMIT